MSNGQAMWHRARKRIAGGNMLLSKRPDMFLPDRWPTYFARARGCRVWDLDGRELIDMATMSVGTNTLGYGHPEVDAAARAAIDEGTMSTLNAPEEVELAERLVAMHPWAEMARFARTGGEANAVAIRIARAASGRDGVAICGYHGWHDWYLATNLGGTEQLDDHLLPGLDPKGVPSALAATVFPFDYNDADTLDALVREHPIGVIKMEVQRNAPPAPGFLERVRAIADANGCVLIFDECTSGFRQTFGGLHLLHDVRPDMAVFGKALGNGYAITAVLGNRAVMEAGQGSFISSTFWTERIGPAAALATLDVMERERSWERITETGNRIKARWQALAEANGVALTTSGLPALAGLTFDGPDALALKTLVTQEMLKADFLATNAVYVSTAHDDSVVDAYFDALDPVFAMIGDCQSGRSDVADLLDGPVCSSGFARLN